MTNKADEPYAEARGFTGTAEDTRGAAIIDARAGGASFDTPIAEARGAATDDDNVGADLTLSRSSTSVFCLAGSKVRYRLHKLL